MRAQELASAIAAELGKRGQRARLSDGEGAVVVRLGGRELRLYERGGALVVLGPSELGEVVEAALSSGLEQDPLGVLRTALRVEPVEALVSARVILRPELRDGSGDVAQELLGPLKPIPVGVVKRWLGRSCVVAPILLGQDGRPAVCRRCRLPLALTGDSCVFCGEPHGVPLHITAKITSC